MDKAYTCYFKYYLFSETVIYSRYSEVLNKVQEVWNDGITNWSTLFIITLSNLLLWRISLWKVCNRRKRKVSSRQQCGTWFPKANLYRQLQADVNSVSLVQAGPKKLDLFWEVYNCAAQHIWEREKILWTISREFHDSKINWLVSIHQRGLYKEAI